jgi:hypothetical protein
MARRSSRTSRLLAALVLVLPGLGCWYVAAHAFATGELVPWLLGSVLLLIGAWLVAAGWYAWRPPRRRAT